MVTDLQYFRVVIEPGEGNYSVYAPELPGCVATGATVEEACREFAEAAAFPLEMLLADGDPLPTPQPLDWHRRQDPPVSPDDFVTHVTLDLAAIRARVTGSPSA